MEKLIVIGAGGHARSVLDILLEKGSYEIAGCLDPLYATQRTVTGMEDIALIGTDEDLDRLYREGMRKIFVAIGSNGLRKKLTEKAVSIGYEPVNAISSHAHISSRAVLGKGICVMAGAVINVNCRIGDGCIINTNCSLDHDCTLGAYSHIAPGAAVSGATSMGEGVHIGTNTAVIDGLAIGEWSYIGAGAAVVKDIPEHVMVYGVPARVVKEI